MTRAGLTWATLAVIAWTMLAWIGLRGFQADPPVAGFDLELLLRAGRDVAAGQSPYDPGLLAGRPPEATGLFFSYPPLVAQVLAPFAAVPSGVMFATWSVAAVAALAAVGVALGRRLRPALPGATVALAVVAVAGLTFPFAIAILFGNVDAFFPALYGLAALAAISGERRHRVIGGVGVALAALTKLYPAGLGLWFLVRAARERGRGSATVVGAAVATGLVAIGLSLLVGGLEPWRQYATVVGAASQAELVDPRNVGPAAQIAAVLSGGSDLARVLQLPIAAAAVVAIAGAAWLRPDPLESLAIAAAATLVLLPISWIHYPAALIPFGAAAVLRAPAGAAARTVATLTAGAVVLGVVALVWLPLMWLGVLLCLAAVHASIPAGVPAAPRGVAPAAARPAEVAR